MTDVALYAPDAERAVIGALLAGWSDTDELGLTGDDFHDLNLGLFYDQLCERIRNRQAVDPVTMRPLVKHLRADQDPGLWLFNLLEAVPIVLNAPDYAAVTAEAAQRRKLLEHATRLQQMVRESIRPAEEIGEDARAWFDTAPRRQKTAARTLGAMLPDIIDHIEQGAQQGTTGPFPDLDRLLNGLSDDRLYVVGARPGVGKSLFVQAYAHHMAVRHGLPVFFASLEMPSGELGTRFLADMCSVNLRAFQNNTLTPAEWERVADAAAKIRPAPLVIDDTPGQTIASIRRGARDTLRTHSKIGAVMIDYLQLLTPRDPRVNRQEQVAEMSRQLKLLSRELHCPVVCLAQLNREAKDRPPVLTDLRESGAIEQDADVVILLSETDQDGEIMADVAKQRHGPQGEVRLARQGHYARLASLAKGVS